MKKFIFIAFLLLTTTTITAKEEDRTYQSNTLIPSRIENPLEWLPRGTIYRVYLNREEPRKKIYDFANRIAHIHKLQFTMIHILSVQPPLALSTATIDPWTIESHQDVGITYGTNDILAGFINENAQNGRRVLLDWVWDPISTQHWIAKEKPEWLEGNLDPQRYQLSLKDSAAQTYFTKTFLKWVQTFEPYGVRIVSNRPLNDEISAEVQKVLSARSDRIAVWNTWHSTGVVVQSEQEIYEPAPFLSADWAGLSSVQKKEKMLQFMQARKADLTTNRLALMSLEPMPGDIPEISANERKMLSVFLWSLHGAVILNAGEEYGRHFSADWGETFFPDWKQLQHAEKDWAKFYRTLNRMRKDHPALGLGENFNLENSVPETVLTYARILRDDALIVAINCSDQKQTVKINLPGIFLDKDVKLQPILSGAPLKRETDSATVMLPAQSAQVWKVKR